jgi:hypothetical protein
LIVSLALENIQPHVKNKPYIAYLHPKNATLSSPAITNPTARKPRISQARKTRSGRRKGRRVISKIKSEVKRGLRGILLAIGKQTQEENLLQGIRTSIKIVLYRAILLWIINKEHHLITSLHAPHHVILACGTASIMVPPMRFMTLALPP